MKLSKFRCFGCTLLMIITGLASGLTLASEVANKHGIVMMDIPGGSFTMGACKESRSMIEDNKKRVYLGQKSIGLSCVPNFSAEDNETPQRQVSIAAFQIGMLPVTVGQFKQFIASANRHDLLTESFISTNNNDDLPVTKVNWNDVQDFIAWLNTTDGGGWRLPSEAEWEYGCRAGGNHMYCGTNNAQDLGWKLDLADMVPNTFGIYAMGGTVWQMVQDCWHDSYVNAPTDGKAWTDNCSGVNRVERGGSWLSGIEGNRATVRNNFKPDNRSRINLGFRLARTIR